VFVNQHRAARRMPENGAAFAALGRWTLAIEALLLVVVVLAPAAGVADRTQLPDPLARPVLAAAAPAANLAYFVRSVLYWRRITRRAPARP
jgi:hypothetical protein